MEFKLPENVIEAKGAKCRDLIVISVPKMGKSSIFGDFTKKNNALVLSLEKGGYEFIAAKKMEIYPTQETDLGEAFSNYIKIRNLLLENKGKYEYLLIDGLSDLDVLSELGGTYAYMDSVIGKKFNRIGDTGEKLKFGDPKFKMVTTLPDGAGYSHTRAWFLQQVEFFKQIANHRIYAAHVADKYVRDNQRDEVVGSELFLTGKLKNIFAAKVTALAKLTADGDKRYLNFDVANDSIIAGSRDPKLKGQILISEVDKEGNLKTFWENIYG